MYILKLKTQSGIRFIVPFVHAYPHVIVLLLISFCHELLYLLQFVLSKQHHHRLRLLLKRRDYTCVLSTPSFLESVVQTKHYQ